MGGRDAINNKRRNAEARKDSKGFFFFLVRFVAILTTNVHLSVECTGYLMFFSECTREIRLR